MAVALAATGAHAQTVRATTSAPLDTRRVFLTEPRAWTHLGGGPAHTGAPAPFPIKGADLGTPDWTATTDTRGPIAFAPQAGVVADDERVYASAQGALAAYDATTGAPLWSASLQFPILDSWSTPTIDESTGVVIAASGFEVAAFDRVGGALAWSTDIGRPIVNASPTLYDAPGPADRVFITDYSFASGATGTLICINTGPFDALENPHAPGDIVWETTLPGETSGNTPAVHAGVVYVSTSDNGAAGPGLILAFNAGALSAPAPLWTATNPEPLGFFGPVAVRAGAVYASSYNFFGGQRSANTIKLDAHTGALIWTTPTVRTNTAPVIVGDANLIVSGGLPVSPAAPSFGAVPAIELIHDHGTAASLVWDSFGATHDDHDADGVWDPGEPFLSLGGWGHTPIALTIAGRPVLLVGTMDEPSAASPLTHGVSLNIIDLALHPSDPGFIVSTEPSAGTTPAIVGTRVFSTSAQGLKSFMLDSAPAQSPAPTRARRIGP